MTENLSTKAAAIVLTMLMVMLGPANTVSAQKMETPADGAAKENEFYLSVLVDFIDDALEVHYTPEKVRQMMGVFKQVGVKRVYWTNYGGARTEMFWRGYGSTEFSRKTVASLGGLPIRAAVAAAREAGLEIYGYIKAYDTGMSYSLPEGSPKAARHGGVPRLGGPAPCVMRFVRDHPELRVRRCMRDIPADIDSIPVRRIKLTKKDDSPTRIRKDNLEIWVSPNNYRYERKEVDFAFREEVEALERPIIDINGRTVTSKGEKVRVLHLEGIRVDGSASSGLTDKYILVTTNLRDKDGDFSNCGMDMIEAYGPDGKQLPISVASAFCLWRPNRNFRTYGLEFDSGYGKIPVSLGQDSSSGIQGFIAFCRGKNEFLPAALCEAYPEVREFWLSLVRECLDAGVDGVDFRIHAHSTHTDEPFAYGFNEPIVEEYARRHGVDISKDAHDPDLLAQLRGDYYTQFLRSASALIRAAGKKMQVHMAGAQMFPDPPFAVPHWIFPCNIKFDWERWLAEGIADEVTIRCHSVPPRKLHESAFSQKVIETCRAKGLPLHFNRYLPPFEELKEEIEIIRRDGRFSSFILYEGKRLVGPDDKDGVKLRGGRHGDRDDWVQLRTSLYGE